MIRRIIFLLAIAISTVSCQFVETIVMEEDGTGHVSLKMDMKEMMAMGGGALTDSIPKKVDTIISMKDVLREKKDSIATLSKAEQKKLKSIENFDMRMLMDPETGDFFFDIFTDFKNIDEANNIMNGLGQSSSLMKSIEGMGVMGVGGTGMPNDVSSNQETEMIGVAFNYKNGKFSRDAYIKDKEKHQTQLDSMGGAEMFLGSIMYKVKYTFPRKIMKSSVEDATYSLDGKTITFERSFMDYIKNPDVLDVEIELEK